MDSWHTRRALLSLALALLATAACLAPRQAAAQDAASAAAARLTAAEDAYTSTRIAFIGETATAEDLYVWSVRWLDASRVASPATIRDALLAHLERMRWIEHEVSQRVSRGFLDDSAVYRTGYYLAEALYWLAAAGYAP